MPLGETPPVMSHHCCMLVDVVQIAEGCRGLKPPQTAPSTGLPAFPSEQMTVFTPLAVSVRDTNSRSLAEPPHAGCGCSPSPSRPEGQVGTRHNGMRLRVRLKALYERAFLLNSLSASTSNRSDYFDCLDCAARN